MGGVRRVMVGVCCGGCGVDTDVDIYCGVVCDGVVVVDDVVDDVMCVVFARDVVGFVLSCVLFVDLVEVGDVVGLLL